MRTLGTLLLALLAACSSGGGGAAPVARAMIGPAGGSIVSADGLLTLDIPTGALPSDTEITIRRAGARAYELGPDGLQFQVPVTATMRLAPPRQPDGSILQEFFVLRSVSGAAVEYLDDPRLVADGRTNEATVSGSLSHFSGVDLASLGVFLSGGGPAAADFDPDVVLGVAFAYAWRVRAQQVLLQVLLATIGFEALWGPVDAPPVEIDVGTGDPLLTVTVEHPTAGLAFADLFTPEVDAGGSTGANHEEPSRIDHEQGIAGDAIGVGMLLEEASAAGTTARRLWDQHPELFDTGFQSIDSQGIGTCLLQGGAGRNVVVLDAVDGKAIVRRVGDSAMQDGLEAIPQIGPGETTYAAVPITKDDLDAFVVIGSWGASVLQVDDSGILPEEAIETGNVTDATPRGNDHASGEILYVHNGDNEMKTLVADATAGRFVVDDARTITGARFPGASGNVVSAVKLADGSILFVTDGQPGQLWHLADPDSATPATPVGDVGDLPRRVRARGNLAAVSSFGGSFGGLFFAKRAADGTWSMQPASLIGTHSVGIDIKELPNGNLAVAATGFYNQIVRVVVFDADANFVNFTDITLLEDWLNPGHAAWVPGDGALLLVSCNGSGVIGFLPLAIDPGTGAATVLGRSP